MKSGIYKILCKENGKMYIGQSKNIKPRIRQHWFELKTKRHGNAYFQNLYDKYGKNCFEVQIIEFCEIGKLDERELFYINLYKSYEKNVGFNIHKFPDFNRSVKAKWQDPEFKNKRSENQKKLWENPEFRKRNEDAIRKTHEERKSRGEVLSINTPEAIKNAKNRQIEAWKNPDYRKGMIEKLKNEGNSAEGILTRKKNTKESWKTRDKQVLIAHNEFQRTNEDYRKIHAERTRNTWKNPIHKSKRIEAIKLAVNDPEVLKNKSESAKKQMQDPKMKAINQIHNDRQKNDPEYKKKHAEKIKALWANPEYRKKTLDAKMSSIERRK